MNTELKIPCLKSSFPVFAHSSGGVFFFLLQINIVLYVLYVDVWRLRHFLVGNIVLINFPVNNKKHINGRIEAKRSSLSFYCDKNATKGKFERISS